MLHDAATPDEATAIAGSARRDSNMRHGHLPNTQRGSRPSRSHRGASIECGAAQLLIVSRHGRRGAPTPAKASITPASTRRTKRSDSSRTDVSHLWNLPIERHGRNPKLPCGRVRIRMHVLACRFAELSFCAAQLLTPSLRRHFVQASGTGH